MINTSKNKYFLQNIKPTYTKQYVTIAYTVHIMITPSFTWLPFQRKGKGKGNFKKRLEKVGSNRICSQILDPSLNFW